MPLQSAISCRRLPIRSPPIEGDEGVSWMLHSVMTPKRAVNSIRGTSRSLAFACELKVN